MEIGSGPVYINNILLKYHNTQAAGAAEPERSVLMDYRVPALSIVMMGGSALAGIAIPVLLFLYFKKKHKADALPFFVGCVVFAVFALILEGLLNSFLLSLGVGEAIKSNIYLYGLFAGFMAGLFEETGRYLAFKTVLKRKLGRDVNALMYGAGHGGFEVLVILAVGMVSNVSIAMLLNLGMADQLTSAVQDSAALAQLTGVFEALATTAPVTFLAGIAERVAAVALHISLSVLVWFAAKDRKLFLLYPLALVLHLLVDMAAVVMASRISNIWIIEGAIYLLAACCAGIACLVWKKHAAPASPEGGPGGEA